MKTEDIFINQLTLKEYDEKAFFKFFDVAYEIQEYQESYDIYYYLKLKFKNFNIATYKISNDGISASSCNICFGKKCDHVALLINETNKRYSNQILNQINIIDAKIKEKIKMRQQKEFSYVIDNLISKIDFEDRLLTQEPVDLQLNINLFTNTIESKIGRNKMYKIKNFYKFIENIKNSETIKYGKELEFIHDLSSFTPNSKNFLTELMAKNGLINSYYSDLKFNSEIADIIFYNYKDYYVYIDSERYLVRLKKIKVLFYINKNYEISINNFTKYETIGQKFLLDKNENVIDILDENDIITELVVNVLKYQNVSIENIKEQFKYSIYLKNIDSFIIDKSIEREFFFEDIDIKAYFDFDNKAITLNTQLFKGELKIQENNLDKYSFKKYYQYLNMINNYGFIENKLVDEAKIINFLSSDLTNLKKLAKIYLSESIVNKKITTFSNPTIKIQYDNQMLSVFFENCKYDDDELTDILKSIRKKKKYIVLKNNIILLNDEAKIFEKMIDDFNIEDDNILREKQRPIYLAFKAYSYDNDVILDTYLDNMIDDIKNFKNANFELPLINGTLRNYQKEGYNWLKILYKYNLGGILADDMGLGKTLQIITLLSSIEEKKPSLIISPTSLIYNWKREFERFSKDIKVVPIYGIAKDRANVIANIKENQKCVYLSSYDSLRNDIDLYENIEFDTLILDEAQFIKNVHAQKTKSIKKVHAKHRYVLTGTPIENNIIDLWSIFDFLMPDYLPYLNDFKANYEKIENYTDVIYKKIAPFVLRRTKKEVLKDLPDKYERIITCELNENQRKVYEAQMLEARNILNNDGKAFDVLYLLTRLRQICVDPKLFIDNYDGTSCKIEATIDIVNEKIANGHRILIFSQFVKALEILENIFIAEQISYKKIIGATSSKERLEICEAFNANNKIKVVLISLKAGGTGLNLIGADVVIHLDPWWNIAAETQASDRAHRIGQTKNVEIIKLICEDSIEKKVLDLQEIKRELFDKIISSDDSSITKITKEDLKYILD